MEAGLLNYIKNMFAMETTPTWDASYEGVLFYDKTIKRWVSSNNKGFQIIERNTTTLSGITPIDWIDPFEYPTDEIINSNYPVTSFTWTSAVTTKSIILDIADSWGATDYIILRSLELLDVDGAVIPLVAIDFTTYNTTNFSVSSYGPDYAFDTSILKTGSINNTSWLSGSGYLTNQRVICVLNTPINVYGITINNGHHFGDREIKGLKNVVINLSSDEITSVVYDSSMTNSTVIFDGILAQHTAVDEVDDQVLVLQNMETLYALNTFSESTIKTYGDYSLKGTASISGSLGASITKTLTPVLNLTDKELLAFDIASSRVGTNLNIQLESDTTAKSAKSVIFDIADQWGGTYLAIRAIEFYYEGNLIEFDSDDATAYATTIFSSSYIAFNAFDQSLSKLGGYNGTQWLTGTKTNQRLIIVFNTPIIFDSVVINNSHATGEVTNQGVKNVEILISPDEITNTVYKSAVSNVTLIFDDNIREHVTVDSADDNVLSLLNITEKAIHNINVTTLNTFQTEFWDVSTLSGTYGRLGFNIVNDDLDNTFYIDNMRFEAKI